MDLESSVPHGALFSYLAGIPGLFFYHVPHGAE